MTKWDVLAAVKRSALPAPARLVMLMLIDAADAESAEIPESFTPSLSELTAWTGLARSTVTAQLNTLEDSGWVKRDRPSVADARSKGAKTRYRLSAGCDPEPKVVRQADQPGSPGGELVREADQVPSPGDGLPVVRDTDHSGPASGLAVVRETDGRTTHPSPTSTHLHPPHQSGDSPTLPLPADPVPKRSKRAAYGSPEFDAWWEIYPRKDDRKKAWSAWEKATKDAEPDEIIAGAKRYRDDPNRSPEYTKLPTTWLNAGAWENGPLPPRSNGHQPYQNPPPDAYGKLT